MRSDPTRFVQRDLRSCGQGAALCSIPSSLARAAVAPVLASSSQAGRGGFTTCWFSSSTGTGLLRERAAISMGFQLVNVLQVLAMVFAILPPHIAVMCSFPYDQTQQPPDTRYEGSEGAVGKSGAAPVLTQREQ
jgi:hypothetical protein